MLDEKATRAIVFRVVRARAIAVHGYRRVRPQDSQKENVTCDVIVTNEHETPDM